MNRSIFVNSIVELCRTTPQLVIAPIAVCEILRAEEDAITYRRGKSRFKVKLQDLYDATDHFSGCRVTTSDIKAFRPQVFDSQARPAGHSCHISLLFSILLLLGIAEELQGRGVRGAPYSVFVKNKMPENGGPEL
jgi:hypothetical protein